MKRVGLVGGLGPESTIDYYRRIIEKWHRSDASTAPPLMIDSLDVKLALRLVEHDRSELVRYLLESVRRLASGGADFIAFTANTPHIVFDELAAQAPVPLLSIVEACADVAAQQGLRRLVLLGTRFTMEAPFYHDVFARHGLEVFVPSPSDREWVHERYVNQLLRGQFRDETRDELVKLISRLKSEHDADGVILGGTELPLLLTTPTIADLPVLDTTELHVTAIVERMRGQPRLGAQRVSLAPPPSAM
jgi:aspartate racemase